MKILKIIFIVCFYSTVYLCAKISPDEVSDDGSNLAFANLEAADFDDPLSPNGESKRNGMNSFIRDEFEVNQ